MSKTIFDNHEFEPYQRRWNERVKRLELMKSYYTGDIYKGFRDIPLIGPRLYKGVKPLYLPLSRAVDVDAGIIPGGWELDPDMPNLEALQQAQDTLFDWSDWDVDGVLFVHYGAQYGVTGLKVSDLRDAGIVVMKPIDPIKFMLIHENIYNTQASMAMIIEKQTDENGKDFEYAEIITPDTVRTFKDGQEWGFDGRDAEYANEQGVVPIVEGMHINTGETMGSPTFEKAIPMLDEVNQIASYLGDIIKKNAEPQWAVMGAESTDLFHAGDVVWFVPQGGSVQALVPQVDITGILEFVKEIRDQVFGSLPEMAFDELKGKDQIATATLELQLMELVLKVKRTRPNYDHTLTDAMRIAGMAAQSMGIGEVGILADEGLRMDQNRPILPLDPETEMKLEMQRIELDQMRAATEGAEGALNG